MRKHAGVFDVSHMTVVDLKGAGVRAFLAHLLANDVGKLKTAGKALYSCMLNEDAGIIDDLIVYYMAEDWFRMVVNAATHDKDVAWLDKQSADFDLAITERTDVAMLAVQGPQARVLAAELLPEAERETVLGLKPFSAAEVGQWFVGRTGYTGEDGFEMMVPAAEAPQVWERLVKAGVQPCGLGARDTLRLEAALNLYGSDMDETTSPLESNLGWTIAWEPADRDFIGRKALETQKAAGVTRKMVGLILEDRGVLRGHQKVFANGGEGEVTSGTFSPTLERSIALARIPVGDDTHCEVEIRGKRLNARIVKPPFARQGKIQVEL